MGLTDSFSIRFLYFLYRQIVPMHFQNLLFRLILLGLNFSELSVYLLTLSNKAKSASSNYKVVLDKISVNCPFDVALAIGPPIFGCAESQVKETAAGTVWCFSAI